jgi:hypothetical protein
MTPHAYLLHSLKLKRYTDTHLDAFEIIYYPSIKNDIQQQQKIISRVDEKKRFSLKNK